MWGKGPDGKPNPDHLRGSTQGIDPESQVQFPELARQEDGDE